MKSEYLGFNLVQRVLPVAHRPDALPPVLAATRSLALNPNSGLCNHNRLICARSGRC